MKKKDLFKKIKNTALNEFNDVLERIDLSKINIDEPIKKQTNFNLKHLASYSFASIFIIISGIFIYNFGIVPNLTNATPFESNTEILGFQTVSGAALIENSQLGDLSLNSTSSSLIELSETTIIKDDLVDEIDNINEYINLAETVIGQADNFIYLDIDSDQENYQYAFEYRGNDLAGNLIVYQGYYNYPNPNNHNFINGVIIHDDVQYAFSSSEINFEGRTIQKLKINIDSDNYVEVRNLSNSKVQIFHYTIYQNGKISNESSLQLSKEHNNLNCKIDISYNKSGNAIKLDITRDNSNPDMHQFLIKYNLPEKNESGNMTVNLKYNQAKDNYQYEYKSDNHETVIVNRTPKGSNKSSKDDFIPNSNNHHQQTTTINNHGHNGNNQFTTTNKANQNRP